MTPGLTPPATCSSGSSNQEEPGEAVAAVARGCSRVMVTPGLTPPPAVAAAVIRRSSGSDAAAAVVVGVVAVRGSRGW